MADWLDDCFSYERERRTAEAALTAASGPFLDALRRALDAYLERYNADSFTRTRIQSRTLPDSSAIQFYSQESDNLGGVWLSAGKRQLRWSTEPSDQPDSAGALPVSVKADGSLHVGEPGEEWPIEVICGEILPPLLFPELRAQRRADVIHADELESGSDFDRLDRG